MAVSFAEGTHGTSRPNGIIGGGLIAALLELNMGVRLEDSSGVRPGCVSCVNSNWLWVGCDS